MHRLRLLVAIAFVLVAHPLRAQARTDTTVEFRRGQWGAEFIPGTSFTTVGVLRFSTPTRAWVLDGSVNYSHQTATATGVPDQSSNSVGLSARFGPRWYHPEYDRAVWFLGLGITGNYFGNSQSANSTNRGESWFAGAYGELGLQYLFTPHLALGVRGNVLASRYSSDYTQNGTTARTTSYSLSLGSPQVFGAFYF